MRWKTKFSEKSKDLFRKIRKSVLKLEQASYVNVNLPKALNFIPFSPTSVTSLSPPLQSQLDLFIVLIRTLPIIHGAHSKFHILSANWPHGTLPREKWTLRGRVNPDVERYVAQIIFSSVSAHSTPDWIT